MQEERAGRPPFWKADPRVWLIVIQHWIDGDQEWDRAVMREDLEWQIDQARMERRQGRPGKLPGARKLAERWRCTRDKAGKVLADALDRHDDFDYRKRPAATSQPPRSHLAATSLRWNARN